MLKKYKSLVLIVASIGSLCVPSSLSEGPVVIHYFNLDKDIVDPGETITATWSVNEAADKAFIDIQPGARYWHLDDPQVGRYIFDFPLQQPITSSPVTVNFTISNRDTYTYTSRRLRVNCTYEWFFEPQFISCPFEPPRPKLILVQKFENGLMAKWSSIKNTIVFFGDDRGLALSYNAADCVAQYQSTIFNIDCVDIPSSEPFRKGLGLPLEEPRYISSCLASSMYAGYKSKSYVYFYSGNEVISYSSVDISGSMISWTSDKEIGGAPIRFIGC